MKEALAPFFLRLKSLREAALLTAHEVDLILGKPKGWVESCEAGKREITLTVVATLLHTYGASFEDLFSSLDLDLGAIKDEEPLGLTQDGIDLVLSFAHGKYPAVSRIPNATVGQARELLESFSYALRKGGKAKAIAQLMLDSVHVWPHANPSDLWLFFVHNAYLNPHLHAERPGGSLEQSWKRASGWALERVFVEHYNLILRTHELSLEMPVKAKSYEYLHRMGIDSHSAAEKADIFIVKRRGVEVIPFGVAHVKASFAERRTDDVPLSEELISKGHLSILLTMDAKAMPSVEPYNAGELGSASSTGSKRLDIEKDGVFDACFSFNLNTMPTPGDKKVAARIYAMKFNWSDDCLVNFLIEAWSNRETNHA